MAIAKVAGASAIYSDDRDVRTFALAEGIAVIGVGELPLPPEVVQPELPLLPPSVGAAEAAGAVDGVNGDEDLEEPEAEADSAELQESFEPKATDALEPPPVP